MKAEKPISKKAKPKSATCQASWKAAEAYGIDMSLIEANLKRSPAERMLRHEAALHTFLMLRKAGKRQNAS